MPGWQALHEELENVDVVTIALDSDVSKAKPWIEKANPTHRSVIDTSHRTGELLGFTNVPMAMWVDENLNIVRPAEAASLDRSPLRDMEIPDDTPAELKEFLGEVVQIPDVSEGYRDALRDWNEKGSLSPFVMEEEQMLARGQARTLEQSKAIASFELGEYFFRMGNRDKARHYWRQAHELDPNNWTFKRQAWSIETTKEGEPSDLMQKQTDVYEGNWLKDVKASGGGSAYYTPPDLTPMSKFNLN